MRWHAADESQELRERKPPAPFIPPFGVVEDVEYVPTRVWTHSGDRSHKGLRMIYTLVFVLTTFIACLLCWNMVIVNGVIFAVLRLLLRMFQVDLTNRPAIREFMECASGWCIDFGAFFICRLMHSLGIWQLTIIGPKVRWRLSRAEWIEWRNGREKENEDGVIMVRLPKDPQTNDIWMVGGSMVVSNHMSNIDGFVTKACLIPWCSKALIKAGVIKAPFVGQLLWASSQCFVWGDRMKGCSAEERRKTYHRCNQVIENNVPIVCYPEGTRRMFGRMNPFKLGMIGAALEHQWPIHVSVIHGSHRAWPPRELLVNKHPIYVKFDDHVIIPRPGIDTPEKLANAIRNRMLKLMQDVPGYEPSIERPLLKSSDLRKIMELAKRKNEIRNSFLD